jgi:PAS domain S-box-containing protein
VLLLAGVGPLAGAPRALSAWLVLAGLALTWLGVDAGRRERRAAAALAARDRAESARRAAFEEAPIGMAIATIDGRFLRVNRALCAFTGREREELEGTPIVRLMHPDDREEAQALVRLARGEGAVRGERRWLHAAGDVMWGAINATLVAAARASPSTCCCRSRT